MNLLPRLNTVNSMAMTLVEQLKELIEAKDNVNKAYEEHCKEAMKATSDQLRSRYDQYTAMRDEELQTIIDETKNDVKEILDKTAAKKAELITKKKEAHAKHLALKQEIEMLAQVEQDAVERLEQLRLDDALKFLDPSG
ncbi:hypothetical protein KR032_006894 [Drosophila birchii]|nr:hypothetical protein KR032_006894 [Drosophila birchii]